jgi:hypothetical protein
MFGVAEAAGVGAEAFAVVSADWVSGFAQAANMTSAAIAAAGTAKGLLEKRLIEKGLLI